MKGKVRLYRTDGEGDLGFPVKIILSYTPEKKKTKTSRRIISYSKDQDWNHSKNLPNPSHPDYEELYDRISIINREFGKQSFTELEDFESAFRKLLGSKRKLLDFREYGEKRAVYMESINRNGNARAYRIALNELKKFQEKVTFDELTNKFLERFKHYKKEDAGNATLKNYLAEFRAIYNSAVKEGITEDKKPFRGVFDDIPVKKRRKKNRYLTKEQLIHLEGLSLKPSYQRAVDLALLQFYLCGADLTDVYYLKNSDIVDNRVWLTRNKLGSKREEFDVLLTGKAERIIEKYRVKGEFVFPWKKHPDSYITFRNNHNRNLKIIQKREEIILQPKNDHLTTKVMRHTFATLGKFERIEEDLLRELMGHERNDIDTVYKDKYPEAERDAAQLQVIDLSRS